MHSQVEYIVAHGIVSEVNGRKVIIGSAHGVEEMLLQASRQPQHIRLILPSEGNDSKRQKQSHLQF